MGDEAAPGIHVRLLEQSNGELRSRKFGIGVVSFHPAPLSLYQSL